MYKIKPIVQVWPELNLPGTMYNVKSIVNLQLEDSVMRPDITVELDEVDQLVARQEKIFLQIEQFKKQLATIKQTMLANAPVTAEPRAVIKAQIITTPVDITALPDLVVNVNPKQIPYSILGLRKLWRKRLSIYVKFFTHSTVSQLPDEVESFMKKVKSGQSPDSALKLTIIWKEVSTNLEVVSSPSSPILLGEINLLRFLGRIGPNEHNYEEFENVIETDSVLDLCYLLVNAATPRDRLAQLRLLNMKLGKQAFFGGNVVSIVDVACSSAIRQLNITKDLTPALKTWLDKVAKEFEY